MVTAAAHSLRQSNAFDRSGADEQRTLQYRSQDVVLPMSKASINYVNIVTPPQLACQTTMASPPPRGMIASW